MSGISLASGDACSPDPRHTIPLNASELLKMLERGACPLWTSDAKFSQLSRNLSENWANEYTGADLMRREFGAKLKTPRDLVAVADIDHEAYRFHGQGVAAIVSGPTEFSILPASEDVHLYDVSGHIREGSKFQRHLTELGAEGHRPKYINLSMKYIEYGEAPLPELIPKADPQTRFIFAAGNDGTEVDEPLRKLAAKDPRVLIVGATSPFGGPYIGSSFGGAHISAPSDLFQAAETEKGVTEFGETSGAAPQVTAALAAFNMISGYHPEPKEAAALLKLSATPLSHYRNEELGGGMLNTYRIAKVAEALRARCDSDKKCMGRLITDPKTYQFEKPADLGQTIEAHFPECGSGAAPATKLNCEEEIQAFARIRKAALLRPQDKSLWSTVACIHEKRGLFVNALHYGKLAGDQNAVGRLRESYLRDMKGKTRKSRGSNTDPLQDITVESIFSEPPTLQYLSSSLTAAPMALERVTKLMEKDGGKEAVGVISKMSVDERGYLFSRLTLNQDFSRAMRKQPPPNWLVTLLNSEDPGKVAPALKLMASWGATETNVQLGAKALRSASPEVQKAGAELLYAAFVWGKAEEQGFGPQIGKAFQEALRQQNPKNRPQIIGVLRADVPPMYAVLKLLAKDPDKQIHKLALDKICESNKSAEECKRR